MREIPKEQVLRRIQAENLWWREPHQISSTWGDLRPRDYFDLLYPLITNLSVRRAVLLMGPRRVGKTVLLHHVIQRLLLDGVPSHRICYLSVDHPLYNGCGLLDLLSLCREAVGAALEPNRPMYVFFDEVQYQRDWEVHLKSLVDTEHNVRFVASGSAAAALKMKSNESGAGRFTDFLLPPLTFCEYVALLGKDKLVTAPDDGNDGDRFFSTDDIGALNREFVRYLNFGGYPEVIFSDAIQNDLARFIKSDIIDKVLLRDLPSLYGIQDIQELNSLFTTLAFNTANEVSLEGLSKNSGVAKNTIKRYIEYLEAAFLIRTVHRIDRSARRFQRANFFKVYLTNPSIRSALFAPLADSDDAFGDLAETGAFSQWFHSDTLDDLKYARWHGGEIDLVALGGGRQKPMWAVEVKWSDRFADKPGELTSVFEFCAAHSLKHVLITSKSRSAVVRTPKVTMKFLPVSLYCYTVGYNLIRGKQRLLAKLGADLESPKAPEVVVSEHP